MLLLGVTLSLFSCQKEVNEELPTTPGGTGGTGGTGGSGGSGNTNPANSYHPLTAGSTWTYKDSTTGTLNTIVSTGKTKVIDGRTYTIVTDPQVSDSAYMSNTGANYYLLGEGTTPNLGASFKIVFHYLNDTAAVGTTWRYNAGHGNGVTAYITPTVMARNLTLNIEGRTYTNVVHTRLKWEYEFGGMTLEMANYDYFTAKGVGIVRVRSFLDAMGTKLETCSNLVDHTIK